MKIEDRFIFRAWHLKAKEMLYEEFVGDCLKWKKEGQPIIILQSTGLKDRNGKLIFEGDRIFWEFNNRVVCGIVEWDICNPCFVLNGDNKNQFEYDFVMAGSCTLEVTGNIYEGNVNTGA